MTMTGKKIYNSDGRSSEDKALDKFAEMMIEKIKTLQGEDRAVLTFECRAHGEVGVRHIRHVQHGDGLRLEFF